MADAAEIQREQSYFDKARDHRERARHELSTPPTAGANPKDSVVLRAGNEALAATFRAPEEAVAFGRIDSDEECLYVGYQLIADSNHEPLVINWKTPAGTRFYESTYDNPLGVVRRRQYEFVGNTNRLEDFEDTLFEDLAARVEELERPTEIDDVLLRDLERTRTGEMQDIVRTIRAAQHEIIRSNLHQLLIVQGGPGTGKTALALHRVSWLLFNHRDELDARNVAVIGPNSAFVRYIRAVLPSLGDHDVRQMPLDRLGPEVRLGRSEPDEVGCIKGEARMALLLERALRDRITVPEEPIDIGVGGRTRRFEPDELAEQVGRLQGSTYSAGRNALREYLRRGNETVIASVDAILDRIWPALSAPALLQDLLGSEGRLVRAAGDDFTAREVRLLYRRSADRLSDEEWSFADVALLDHSSHLIAGPPSERFDHLVVDEAQDSHQCSCAQSHGGQRTGP